MERYLKMKKEELAALAREAGLKGRSTMTKAQLARALADLSAAVEPAPSAVPASVPADRIVKGPIPAAEPEIPHLPDLLGQTRLCLLPQTPTTAFAYWELEEDPSGELLLRIYALPGGREIMVREATRRQGSLYIHLPGAAMEIEGELVFTGPGGSGLLARSNRIRLPYDTPSEEVDTLWMTRRRDFEEIYRLSGGGSLEVRENGAPGAGIPGGPSSSWKGQGGGQGR